MIVGYALTGLFAVFGVVLLRANMVAGAMLLVAAGAFFMATRAIDHLAEIRRLLERQDRLHGDGR